MQTNEKNVSKSVEELKVFSRIVVSGSPSAALRFQGNELWSNLLLCWKMSQHATD